MKRFSLRMAFAVVLAFVAIAMGAQESINVSGFGRKQVVKIDGLNTSDAEAVYEVLTEHPDYAVVLSEIEKNFQDSVTVDRVLGILNGNNVRCIKWHHVIASQKEVNYVPSAEMVATDSVAIESKAAAVVSTVASEKYDTFGWKNEATGKEGVYWANPINGFFLGAKAGFQYSENLSSPFAGITAAYYGKWWMAEVGVDALWNKYNSNAIKAEEKYWTMRSTLDLGVQPFHFGHKINGKYVDRVRLMVGPRLGYVYYLTDSKEAVNAEGQVGKFQSGGNYLALGGFVQLTVRSAKSGNQWKFKAAAMTGEDVIQNDGSRREVKFEASVGYEFNLGKKVSNVSSQKKSEILKNSDWH